MVCRAIDVFLEPVACDHIAIVDEDSPDLHQAEEDQVKVLLHGADEDKNTITVVSERENLTRTVSPDTRDGILTGRVETEHIHQAGGKPGLPKELALGLVNFRSFTLQRHET